MTAAPAPVPFIPAPASDGKPVVAAAPEALKAPKKEIPSTPNKVVGARVIIQYRDEVGNIHEATTTISSDDYKVQSYALNVDEKHEKKRDPETKDIIGFEDTGERILTFKMRYHVR